MGSGSWFKTIIGRKKGKKSQSWWESKRELAVRQHNGSLSDNHKDSKVNACSSRARLSSIQLTEDAAATRIQAAFRSYKARRIVLHLKGIARLSSLAQSSFTRKQTMKTLSYLQVWHKIQSEILNRRQYMVAEGRKKQKKLEIQQKLEAKLNGIEVEWCGGSETKEEIVSRIQQREEAAVKRERALAYAFSHQWRVNSGQSCSYDFGKGDWGWSWMDRWIAARPWESRVNAQNLSSDKSQTTAGSQIKKGSSVIQKTANTAVKPGNGNGRGLVKRMSYPTSADNLHTFAVATALKVKNVKNVQEHPKD